MYHMVTINHIQIFLTVTTDRSRFFYKVMKRTLELVQIYLECPIQSFYLDYCKISHIVMTDNSAIFHIVTATFDYKSLLDFIYNNNI